MLGPSSFPFLPTRADRSTILGTLHQSIAWIRFGRKVRQIEDLRRLYRQSFDFELAVSSDFCTVPAGWVEHHTVRLPAIFTLITKKQIETRLERMVHAPRDREAIDAITAAASYVTAVTGDGMTRRKHLIQDLGTVADKLVQARATHPGYVAAMLYGRLDRCLDMLAADESGGLSRPLLVTMTRLWMLHDLQVIAARLFKSIYLPSEGFIEGLDAGPQSFQSFAHDPIKMGEMAEIAARLMGLKPGHETPTDQAERKRFWGFVTGTEFRTMAREVGFTMGFAEDELDAIDTGQFNQLSKIAKMFRRFAVAGGAIGRAFQHDLRTRLDDRAPLASGPRAKATGHASASMIRYGFEAPAALAHAIVAFLELSDRLPDIVERYAKADRTILDTPIELRINMRARDHIVTFERMFAAYRAIFLRDPNYLRDELSEMLPHTSKDMGGERSPIFASNEAAKGWRRDFILGRVSTIGERLGETEPLTAPDGVEPGLPTQYGRSSLNKALAIIRRNSREGNAPFDPSLTPAIIWRFTPPSP